MSKAKELQSEIENLKYQLAQVSRERETQRSIADARLRDIYNLSNTVTSQRQELHTQKQEHQRQMTQKHLSAQAAIIRTVEICAEKTDQALEAQARNAELAIVAAERDALGEAFKYVVDNITTNR